jgi:hypothetical protein
MPCRSGAKRGPESIRMVAQRTNAANAPLAPRPHTVAKAPPQARLRRLSAPRIQAKLTGGAANDPLEHEADAVAEIVMRMPDPALSVSAAPLQVSRKCAVCEAEALRPWTPWSPAIFSCNSSRRPPKRSCRGARSYDVIRAVNHE